MPRVYEKVVSGLVEGRAKVVWQLFFRTHLRSTVWALIWLSVFVMALMVTV
jgi:hypothetical protein